MVLGARPLDLPVASLLAAMCRRDRGAERTFEQEADHGGVRAGIARARRVGRSRLMEPS